MQEVIFGRERKIVESERERAKDPALARTRDRTVRARKVAKIFTLERWSVPSIGGIINIHNPELETSVERAARQADRMRRTDRGERWGKKWGRARWEHTRGQRAYRAKRASDEQWRERENALTAKDPNRRVNTLLTLRREARKPNGIRFGDLVGGLRRPPAATTASSTTLPRLSSSRSLYWHLAAVAAAATTKKHSDAACYHADACVPIPLKNSSALRKLRLDSIKEHGTIMRSNEIKPGCTNVFWL